MYGPSPACIGLGDGEVHIPQAETGRRRSWFGVCALYLGQLVVQAVDVGSLQTCAVIADDSYELQSLRKNIVVCVFDALADCTIAFEPPKRVVGLALDAVAFWRLVAESDLGVFWDVRCGADYEHVTDETSEGIAVASMVDVGCKGPYTGYSNAVVHWGFQVGIAGGSEAAERIEGHDSVYEKPKSC